MTPVEMERLKFLLPDFARLSWVSDAARQIWEFRILQIAKAWFEIEWRAVLADIRDCGLTISPPEDLVKRTDHWVKHGLVAIPLEIQGLSEGIYSATSEAYEQGNPFVYRVVVIRPDAVMEFKKAWDENDHQKIGALLGYPACCQKFFRDTWVDQSMVDTTWPMAAATGSLQEGKAVLEVGGPPEANILWRWMGIRAVPHLPCSFTCQATVEFGKKMIQVGRNSGFDQEMDWMLEILSWPVEWSALHGIAEVKTPILRVSARTDATPWKYVVRRKGSLYPAEGATGLVFPYETPQKTPLTRSQGFRRGLENPISASENLPDWYGPDNGFDSVAAMNQAHTPIVELAVSVLKETSGSVLDLGCGNAALLKKIVDITPKILPFGVEISPARHQHIAAVHPQFFDHFECADIFESQTVWEGGRRFSLAILMPGRLLEAAPEQVRRLRGHIQAQCDQVLVYAYGDWLERFGGLHGLAREAGMRLLDNDPGLLAGMVEFE